ncbi:MAG: YHYH protein [Saprospiraceae bacterium]
MHSRLFFSKSFNILSNLLLLIAFIFTVQGAVAQINPAITVWKINKNGETGFGGFTTNVQQVQYSSKNVYISTNGIADWIPIGYDWPNNPWSPKAQNFVFKLTLNPTKKTGTKIATPYGHIGLWTNGVSIYNPKDAKSWRDSNVWFQNAYYFEHVSFQTFDPCFGHPNGRFEYHLHVNPFCLYDSKDSSKHSPIIGYAFDGFPIYGAYGYSNADGSGGIKRMKSSYRVRNISERVSLPNGTVLPFSQQGPPLNLYPLGAYCEDFEYVSGLGDLDEDNGRFCKTPEYPNGTYAYFTTIDEKYEVVYPYVLGKNFYGTVQMGNTGPNSGYNVINEPVIVYTTAGRDLAASVKYQLYPNPASDELNLFIIPSEESNFRASCYNMQGDLVFSQENIQSAVNYNFDLQSLPCGQYLIKLENAQGFTCSRFSIQK